MIFRYYTFAVICAMLLPLLPFAPLLSNFSGSLESAYWYVMLCYLAFFFAYQLTTFARASTQRPKDKLPTHTPSEPPPGSRDISIFYLSILLLWAIIGAVVSVSQIQMTLGLGNWADMIAAGGDQAVEARGNSIGVEGSEGGLPGVIKMWNQNPTASVLIIFYLMTGGVRFKGFSRKLLAGAIFFCFVIRNSIYMDRLALLALIPAMLVLWRASNRSKRKVLLFGIAAVALLAEFQSRRRGLGFGSLSFFVLYVQSGMINTSLMIDSFAGNHTNGFSSVLSPIYYFLKAFHTNLLASRNSFQWLWNGAQNAYGYLFMDFGRLAPLVLLPIGVIAQLIDAKPRTRNPSNHWKITAKLRVRTLASYAALSTMFVPAYQGPEFWLLIVTVSAAAWFEHHRPRLCFSRTSKTVAPKSPHRLKPSYAIG